MQYAKVPNMLHPLVSVKYRIHQLNYETHTIIFFSWDILIATVTQYY